MAQTDRLGGALGERVEAFLIGSGHSVARIANAHELLVRLAASGRWPADVSGLEPLLGPVLCSNERELEQFRIRFRAFFQPEAEGRRTTPTVDDTTRPLKISRSRWFVWSAVALTISLAVISPIVGSGVLRSYLTSPPPPSMPRPPAYSDPIPVRPTDRPSDPFRLRIVHGVLLTAGSKPVSRGAIYCDGNETSSGPDGRFQVSAAVSAAWLLVAHQLYDAKLVPLEAGSDRIAVVLTPKQGIPDVPGLPAISLSMTAPGTGIGDMPAIALAVAGLLGFACAAVYIWSQWLKRSTVLPASRMHNFALASFKEPLFPLSALRQLARLLRKTRPTAIAVLNVPRTVEATANQGGYFTRIDSYRCGIPEYLVLIDRFSPGDQSCAFRHELFRTLAKHNVRIHIGRYSEDPRFAFDEDGTATSLGRLLARFPGHIPIVYCDAYMLADPGTGQPAPWLRLLSGCRQAALLLPLDQYRYDASFFRSIVPANVSIVSSDLSGLAEWAGQSLPEVPGAPTGPYPQTVREFPSRWLEAQAPDRRTVARLMVELRNYLGAEGMICLAACAMFPVILWDLTAHLASRIIVRDDSRNVVLERLTLLPWFRYGSMPEWLGLALTSLLDEEDAGRLRRLIKQYLRSRGNVEGASFEAGRGAARKSDRRQRILMLFMLGWNPRDLRFRAPGRLRTALLAWRPIAAALGSAVLVGATVFLAFPAAPSVGLNVSIAGPRPPESIQQTPFVSRRPDQMQSDRVLDVAASQVGIPSSSKTWSAPFVAWVASTAASIARKGDYPVLPGESDDAIWKRVKQQRAYNPDLFVQDPARIKPGHLVAHTDPAGFHLGFVEYSDGAGNLSTIEPTPGLGSTKSGPTIVRRYRTFRFINGAVIDPSAYEISLFSGGRPFRFAGFNNYYLGFRSDAMVQDVFRIGAEGGLRVARTWAFYDTAGPQQGVWFQGGPGLYNDGANGLQLLDRTIQMAEKYGIKLVLPLVNYWPDFGGMQQYAQWLGLPRREDFYTDPGAKQAYRDWVTHLLLRTNTLTGRQYRDEPAILSWELAQEARCEVSRGREILRQWATEMSAFVKSLDAKHLVALGDEGFFARAHAGSNHLYNGQHGGDFEALLAIENIDYGGFNLFPEYAPQTDPIEFGDRWIREHAEAGRRIGKPVVLNQYGILMNRPEGPTRKNNAVIGSAERDRIFKAWLETAEREKVAGANLWMVAGRSDEPGKLYPDYDGFTVYSVAEVPSVSDFAKLVSKKAARSPAKP